MTDDGLMVVAIVLAGILIISSAWRWMHRRIDASTQRQELRNREVSPARMRRLWIIDDERNLDQPPNRKGNP